MRSPPSKEKVAAETTCDELITTPIPHCPLCCLGGGGRETGSEVEPRKKGGVRGRSFKIWFYFLLTYSDLIGNKLN